jgi:hypothetical protein
MRSSLGGGSLTWQSRKAKNRKSGGSSPQRTLPTPTCGRWTPNPQGGEARARGRRTPRTAGPRRCHALSPCRPARPLQVSLKPSGSNLGMSRDSAGWSGSSAAAADAPTIAARPRRRQPRSPESSRLSIPCRTAVLSGRPACPPAPPTEERLPEPENGFQQSFDINELRASHACAAPLFRPRAAPV